MKKYLPILNWLPNYNRTLLKGDVSAGLTVGVMLIPQGMAYAMLAGLPPIYGLYASIVPLIIYAILGTSRQLAVGPVAMISLLVAAGVGTLAKQGTAEYIQLAVVLAFLVGIIQTLMGVFRLGFMVNFLSQPVISGFTSAAALIIGASQLKHLLGIDIPRSNRIDIVLNSAFTEIESTNFYTLAIGLIAILIIVFIKKQKTIIPGALVVVVLAGLVVWGFELDQKGVHIMGTVPEGLPNFAIPVLQWDQLKSLFPIALTIAFINFMQSMAVAKAIQNKHRNYQVIPNQELIALGAANIFGSFFQAYPTTGGFARTAVNDQTGAKTGLASIISALLIIVTLLFLTPLFYYLPKAILASIIMVAVYGLFEIKEAIRLWKYYRPDFWMLAATFVGTLFLGIEEGVLLGAALSIGLMIYRTTRPHIAVLGKIPDEPYYRNIDRFEGLLTRPELLIIRFDARLYYANVDYFTEQIKALIEQKGIDLKQIILDADPINGIDSTGVRTLEAITDYCTERSIIFSMVGVKGPIRDIFARFGLFDKIGKEHFFFRIQHAVNWFDKKEGANCLKNYTLQVNKEL